MWACYFIFCQSCHLINFALFKDLLPHKASRMQHWLILSRKWNFVARKLKSVSIEISTIEFHRIYKLVSKIKIQDGKPADSRKQLKKKTQNPRWFVSRAIKERFRMLIKSQYLFQVIRKEVKYCIRCSQIHSMNCCIPEFNH